MKVLTKDLQSRYQSHVLPVCSSLYFSGINNLPPPSQGGTEHRHSQWMWSTLTGGRKKVDGVGGEGQAWLSLGTNRVSTYTVEATILLTSKGSCRTGSAISASPGMLTYLTIKLLHNLQLKELLLLFPSQGSIPSGFWVIEIILRAEIIR